jgi:hypothetical protein
LKKIMKYKKYEKCLFELITEKNNIMANKDYHTILHHCTFKTPIFIFECPLVTVLRSDFVTDKLPLYINNSAFRQNYHI